MINPCPSFLSELSSHYECEFEPVSSFAVLFETRAQNTEAAASGRMTLVFTAGTVCLSFSLITPALLKTNTGLVKSSQV